LRGISPSVGVTGSNPGGCITSPLFGKGLSLVKTFFVVLRLFYGCKKSFEPLYFFPLATTNNFVLQKESLKR
jgi:hypothetical protein